MPYNSIIYTENFKKTVLIGTAMMTIAVLYPIKNGFAMEANTLPSGEKIIGGEAYFDRSEKNTLNIKQGSDRLFINWNKGFNIGEEASVNFYQPNEQSIVINRVTGKNGDPTQILGRLSANGRVIILDKNGIIFGKNAVIDVGGIIASTGNINVKGFMKGEKTFKLENITKGSVINAGSITVADAGLAAFVAPNVVNDGLIIARKGTILMGHAKTVTFDLYGDGLIEISSNKNLKNTKIENNGKMDIEGGRVILTSAYVEKTVKTLINLKDIVESNTFKVHNGKIILSKIESINLPPEIIAHAEPVPEVSAPAPSAPVVSAPIVTAPAPSAPIVSAPIVTVPAPSAPVVSELAPSKKFAKEYIMFLKSPFFEDSSNTGVSNDETLLITLDMPILTGSELDNLSPEAGSHICKDMSDTNNCNL